MTEMDHRLERIPRPRWQETCARFLNRHRGWLLHKRRLQSAGEPRRRDALRPADEEPRGLIVRLFPDEGYGFLGTPYGEERYFHRNSVLHDNFDRLAVGTEVRFEPEMGDAGP